MRYRSCRDRSRSRGSVLDSGRNSCRDRCRDCVAGTVVVEVQ